MGCQQQTFKKQAQKSVLGTFLDNFDQNVAFYWRRALLLKISHIVAKDVFRDNLGLVSENWMSLSYTKGGTLWKNLATRIEKTRSPPPPRHAAGCYGRTRNSMIQIMKIKYVQGC